MSFVGQASLSHAWRCVHAKGLRANPSFEPTRSGRPLQAENEMKAKLALPERVRSMEGLGLCSPKRTLYVEFI